MSSASTSKATGNHTNPEPTPEVAAMVSDRANRQRGPVEEVIFKRMKQLGKKLQRYRSYAAKDANTLNADQRSALIALPALEGAYKELEDLVREKGPVEEQELIQSAKLREAMDAARAAALAEAGSSTEKYKASSYGPLMSSLVQPLSVFLRLYALLHPARSGDHENLTFAPLDLPDHLIDEVQATDVLRVARLYEDLTAGGERGQAVLDLLVAGPTGEDGENDRVHHLIELLARPEAVVETSTATPTETGEASQPTADADFTAAALAESVEEAKEAAPEAAAVPKEASSQAHGQASAQPSKPTAINFLQADELEQAPEQGQEQEPQPDQSAEAKEDAIEESYEIVPNMEAHQTSGQQPPAEASTPSQPPPTSRTPSNFAPAPTGSWADLDDEEDFLGSAQAAASQFAAAIVEPSMTSSAQGESGSTQKSASASADASAPAEGWSPQTSQGRPPRGPRGQGRGRGNGARRGNGRQQSQNQGLGPDQQSASPNEQRRPQQPRPQQQHRQSQQQQQQQPQAAPGSKLVDDDGFEMKTRRAPTQAPGQNGRGGGGMRGTGRGGPRGGAGGGSERGRGGGSGRGRGGANGAGVRTASGTQQGQTASGEGQKKTDKPAATKGSIFKAVQPTGPKSAPVLS